MWNLNMFNLLWLFEIKVIAYCVCTDCMSYVAFETSLKKDLDK